jgi:hypothetical protein
VTPRVEVLPGPGTAIRSGQVAVWAGPGVSAALLDFLLRSAHNVGASPRGGRQMVEHLAGILSQRDPEPGAPFGIVGPADGGWVTLLHGPVQIWDGRRWLAPSPTPGWLQAPVVPEPALSLGPAGSAPPPLDLTSLYDLERGMVPAGGLLFVLPQGAPGDAAPASPARTPEPTALTAAPGPLGAGPTRAPGDPTLVTSPPGAADPTAVSSPLAGSGALLTPAGGCSTGTDPTGTLNDPTATGTDPTATLNDPTATGTDPTATLPNRPDGAVASGGAAPAGVIDLSEKTPAGASAPGTPAGGVEVEGRRCVDGTLNHPAATVCLRCGRDLGSAPLVRSLRPPLGVLIDGDGSVYRVGTDLVLGADPAGDPSVLSGRAGFVRVADSDHSVAPAHAEIRLEDWRVTLVDRGSANGTFVVPPGQSSWTRLPTFQRIPLRSGSHLCLGQRVLTFVGPWPDQA